MATGKAINFIMERSESAEVLDSRTVARAFAECMRDDRYERWRAELRAIIADCESMWAAENAGGQSVDPAERKRLELQRQIEDLQRQLVAMSAA